MLTFSQNLSFEALLCWMLHFVVDLAKLFLSRHATPYHAPLYLAQARGYFKDEGLKVALLEPNDPSDVTEIVGSGKVDMGFKAMIHTLAVRTPSPAVTNIPY